MEAFVKMRFNTKLTLEHTLSEKDFRSDNNRPENDHCIYRPLLSPKILLCVLVSQSCPTLCDSMDCNPLHSSVHEIFQSRTLEWIAIPFSRGCSQPRDQTWVFFIVCRVFTTWATWEALKSSSVQFSHLVMSSSLWSHGLWHTRLPCPSATPGVYSNSCSLSQWCHPTISSSVIAFSSHPLSFPASRSFQMSQLFTSGGQSIGVSASTSVLLMNTQDSSPLGWIGWISL